MTRLPWQQDRPRARSGTDRSQIGHAQDWFSRTSEPSRQALSDLVKEHRRENSDERPAGQSRSRGSTIMSPKRSRERKRSQTETNDITRPNSMMYNREDLSGQSSERGESVTKNLLSKSSQMLRRKGSKVSLASTASTSTLGMHTPSLRTHANSPAASLYGDDIRKTISSPFNFQHITHTEQSQFSGLGRIEEADLAHQFHNVTTGQYSRPSLKGIDANSIYAQSEHQRSSSIARSATDTFESHDGLPVTPPCPTPPPKDNSAASNLDASDLKTKAARHVPTPLILEGASGTTQDYFSHMPVASCTAEDATKNKALPDLPEVIHAVTTTDDSARMMIAAPLPTPPGVAGMTPPISPGPIQRRAFHRPQKSSLTLRRNSYFPVAKNSMPNLLTDTNLSIPLTTLPRHRSDIALSQQAKQVEGMDMEQHVSGSNELVDWESAVDEAWDCVDTSPIDNVEMYAGPAVDNFRVSGLYTNQSSRLDSSVVQSATPSALSQARSGASSSSAWNQDVDSRHPIGLTAVPEQSALTGLGISSTQTRSVTATTGPLSRSSSSGASTKHHSNTSGFASNLSRSSSQDSFNLSLASSYIGTCRSSNSSMGDYEAITGPMYTNHGAVKTSSLADGVSQEENDDKKDARPESGCLPANIAEQLASLSVAEPAAPNPLTPQHKHAVSMPKVNVVSKRTSGTSATSPQGNRQRSSTIGSRPRTNNRVSYSLFPAVNAAPLSSSTTGGSPF